MKGPCCLLLILCVVSVDPTESITTSRIWTISLLPNLGGLVYEEGASLKGVLVDLIDAVCGEADMDYRLLRGHVECWRSSLGSRSSGGRALFGRWCDACITGTSVERFAAFKFTISMYKRAPRLIYVLKGRTFDASNLRGRKIGTFQRSDSQCFARHGVDFSHHEDNTILYHRTAERGQIIPDLQSGKIDGFFSGAASWTTSDLDIIEPITNTLFYCNLDGVALMSRKDSHFTANWNVGATKLKNTPKWVKMCSEKNKKHGHKGGFLLECKE